MKFIESVLLIDFTLWILKKTNIRRFARFCISLEMLKENTAGSLLFDAAVSDFL